MPRAQCGRGGGAKRGRGAKAFASSGRKPKPHQKHQQEKGSGDAAGVSVAPVRVKAIKSGGLGEGSRALILQMMHELRLQEEEDERLLGGETTGAAAAAGEGGGGKRPSSSRPSKGPPSAESMAALEASLLEGGGERESRSEIDDATSSSSGESGSDFDEEDDEVLDGTFRRAANHLAGAEHESSVGSSDEVEDEDEEEESDEGEEEEEEEEDDGAAAAAATAATAPDAGPAKPKKLSQKDQRALLKTLITEEREAYVAEQRAAREAAVAAAIEGGGAGKGKPIKAGGVKSKVRVTLVAEKGGAKKLVVVDRKKTLDGLFAVAKAKLKIKKPRRAYLGDTKDELESTFLLADDAVVVVSDRAAEKPAAAAAKAAAASSGGAKEEAAAPAPAAVDHEAELDLVKEAYKRRTDDRYDDNAGAAGAAAAEGPEAAAARRAEGARMKEALERREASAEFGAMKAQRLALPATGMRERIVAAVNGSQVVVVEGETGSGKTTQVPQFILDDWIAQGRGAECFIICTQPRRISAIGVAERVASERLEGVGGTVGYQIRLESRRSARTRLLFCTTGILLRRLMGDPELAGVSHVIVDEVHERSIESDFLLIILRDLLQRRAGLKVVLMSATIEAQLFQTYMGGCPSLHIPGRTHPVEVLYLEQVAGMLEGGAAVSFPSQGQGQGQGQGKGKGDWRQQQQQQRRPAPPGAHRRGESEEAAGEDGEGGDEGEDAARALAETFGAEEARQMKALLSPRSDKVPIDYDLVVRLTRHVVEAEAAARKRKGGGHDGKGGAVLVFLPGFAEIERAIGQMRRDPVLGSQERARLFPLHSSLSTEAQRSIFKTMPPGVTKVVVATNIAETSITIDDVSYVIDSCRVKETAFDPHTHMSSLREVWVSKAAASQRAGRAGRVRPGTCFRLVPQDHYQRVLLDYTLPEIRRTTLEDLVLRVLMLELGQPKEFLGRAIQPPSSKAVKAAVRTLEEIEAIHIRPGDDHIILRPLGFHLAALPLDVRLGKMLIIACIFDCLDPMLTIAAALSGKSVFATPFGGPKREEAWQAKQRFADAKSDHLALVEAWKAWCKVKDQPWPAKKEFLRTNYLSLSALESLESVRRQILNDLVACGFAPPPLARKGQAAAAPTAPAEIDYTANQYDVALLKCILVAGLAPQIAKLVRPTRGQGAHFVVRDGSKVWIHPSSVNAKRVREAGPAGREALALYHRKVETTRVYLHDTTFVSSLSLLLFGTHVRIAREHGGVASKATTVVVDGWVGFKMREESSVLLKVLKKKIDEVLLLKIARPHEDHVRRLQPVVKTIRKLLHAEMAGNN